MGDLTRYNASDVSAALSEQGLRALSLTPENVDLAHPDEAVRQEALDYYYRLLDLAGDLGCPIVCCHGKVGRIRAVTSYEEERRVFSEGVRRIAERAQASNLRIALEVLNRYEAHLLNTALEAQRFVRDVGMDNVGILLDAYHMNIEEADPLRAHAVEARYAVVLVVLGDVGRLFEHQLRELKHELLVEMERDGEALALEVLRVDAHALTVHVLGDELLIDGDPSALDHLVPGDVRPGPHAVVLDLLLFADRPVRHAVLGPLDEAHVK
jgi:hypothetical protein